MAYTMLLLIIFEDGSRKVISGVENYGCLAESDIFWFDKNGRRSFLPVPQVRYFGSAFDCKRLISGRLSVHARI